MVCMCACVFVCLCVFMSVCVYVGMWVRGCVRAWGEVGRGEERGEKEREGLRNFPSHSTPQKSRRCTFQRICCTLRDRSGPQNTVAHARVKLPSQLFTGVPWYVNSLHDDELGGLLP